MPRALISDPDRHATDSLRSILEETGIEVEVGTVSPDSILKTIRDGAFDLLFIAIPADPSRLSELLKGTGNHHRSRIVLTGASPPPEILRDAFGSGVACFLGKPFRKQDVIAGIELAISHTEQLEGYRDEISRLKAMLEQRKLVERAKGILMERKSLNEAEAYRLMQTTAMKRRITLREVAERILSGTFT